MDDKYSTLIIRDNSTYDGNIIDQVVDIHMKTFSGFFLTFLGRGFLKQLYKGFCSHEQSGVLVAELDDYVVGFLAYSEDLGDFYKYLIKRSWLPFTWYSIGAVIRKPSAITKLIRAFLKPGESERKDKYIALSSIGVLPEAKNQHVGSRLIDGLKKNFDSEQFDYIKLETDAVNNDDVNAFYVSNGFSIDHEYTTPEGRRMNEYRWSR